MSDTESDPENTVIESKCPCQKNVKCIMIKCGPCQSWYHTWCVGLKGLSKKMLEKMTSWRCPFCLDITKLKPTIGEANLKEVTDKIEETLASVIENKIEEKTKEVFADIVENTNKTIELSHSRVVQSAMQNSREKMDIDHIERERRKSNIVVRDVDESNSNNPQDRKNHDIGWAMDLLDLGREDIVNVFRAGAPRQDGRRTRRPLIITLSSPQLASQVHKHGRGRRVTFRDNPREVFWLNQDLIKSDRIANAKAREARQGNRGQRNLNITLDAVSNEGTPQRLGSEHPVPPPRSRERRRNTPDLRSPPPSPQAARQSRSPPATQRRSPPLLRHNESGNESANESANMGSFLQAELVTTV